MKKSFKYFFNLERDMHCVELDLGLFHLLHYFWSQHFNILYDLNILTFFMISTFQHSLWSEHFNNIYDRNILTFFMIWTF